MSVERSNSHWTPMPLIGVGIYTPREASKLIDIPTARLRRWLTGYSYKSSSGKGGKRYMRALWEPQIQLEEDGLFLSFKDLIEVRVADALIAAGLSPQKLRRLIERAREVIGEEYPLSTAKFRTDGHSIFLSTFDEDGDEKLLDLLRNQYAFRKILEPLLENVDFEDKVPARWWPLGQRRGIVIDPARSFGQPVDNSSGVPTNVLALAVQSEGSPQAAASAYKVHLSSVRNALRFEARLVA